MIESKELLESKEERILRGKTEREEFFRMPRRIPEGLKLPEKFEKELKEEDPELPDEFETELKEGKSVVPKELQDKIDEEVQSLTEEYPVSQ